MAEGEVSGSDFFLQFGSDADDFSAKLVEELPKGEQAIKDLRTALENYEAVANRVSTGKITFNFEGLTSAADRIESATTQFTKQFGTQLTKLTTQVAGLAESLRTAERGLPVTTTNGHRPAQVGVPVSNGGQPAQGAPISNGHQPVQGVPVSNGHQPAQGAPPGETGPARPPLRPRPAEPKPPKDPYGSTLPKVLEQWPAAPQSSDNGKPDPKEQALYQERLKKFISGLSPADQDIVRKHDQVMTAFDAEMKKFSADHVAWAKQVRAIDAANEKIVRDWETTTGQSWNATAPAAPPKPRPIQEVPAEPTRPQQPQVPQALADRGFQAPPAKESDRYEKQYDLFQAAHPDLAAAADEYRDLVEDFHKADAAFTIEYDKWRKAKAVIERANAEAHAYNSTLPTVQEPVARVEPPAPPVPQAAATQVPEADVAAARAIKHEKVAEEQQAVRTLAEFSAGLATSTKAVEDALDLLATRLAEGASKPSEAASGADGGGAGRVQQVEVVNVEADAIPVVLVGGEEQAHEGKGKGKGGEPHKATTATANAKAAEELHGAVETSGSISEPHAVPPAGPQKTAAEEVTSAVTPVATALTETVRSIEQWQSLTESRRQRLERNGITQEAYLAGAPLGAAGGKSPVPAAQRAYDQAVSHAGANLDDDELARFNPYEHPEVAEAAERLQRAHAEQASVEAARARRAAAEAAAAAPQPVAEPVVPPAPPVAGPNHYANLGTGKQDLHADAGRRAQFSTLQPEVQRSLTEGRDRLTQLAAQEMTAEVRAEMDQIVARTAHDFRADPASGMKYTDPATGREVNNRATINPQFGNSTGSMRAYRDFMGLNGRGSDDFVRKEVFPRGGLADRFNERTAGAATTPTPENTSSARVKKMSDAELASNAELLAKTNEILATTHGDVTKAALAHARAEAALQTVQRAEVVDAEAQIAAMTRVMETKKQLANAENNQAKEEGPSPQQTRYQQFKGTDTTFGQDLRRHLANTGLNQVGWTLSFLGFDKMKELVDVGIQAQAVFVRLQSSLEANGKTVGNLQTQLAQTSASTATPLEKVMGAAADLSGTFKSVGDIAFGANIASQLANISQGTLTAQEAAVGLRDVYAAFGDEWAKNGMSIKQGLQETGDQIAHLSQLTGVSVKDITEGTTQIAQEAHEFGLNQRQASTLAAYVSLGTGETGEESAAQTSRMLATLYNGKTQNILSRTVLRDPKTGKPLLNPNGSQKTLATNEEFASGQTGQVLEDIARYWATLTHSQRNQISDAMGKGIQARPFAAYVSGGTKAADAMDKNVSDSGALSSQMQRFLKTVEGEIKQLDEDFQNLGNTLQRLGAFDAIGALAKAADELFKTFNKVFGGLASLADSNPLTKTLMHWGTLILELTAAWKLFGGTITTMLARRGVIGTAGLAVANPTAVAAGANPSYRAVGLGTAAGAVAGRGTGIFGRIYRGVAGPYADFNRRYYDQSVYGGGTNTFRSLIDPGRVRTGSVAAYNFAQRNIPRSMSDVRQIPASLGTGAQNAFFRARYGPAISSFGVGPQPFETRENTIRAADVRSALREQRGIMGATARSTGQTPLPLTSATTKGVEDNMRGLGLSARSASILIRTSSEEQAAAMNTMGFRMKAFAQGLGSSLAGLGASIGLFVLIGAIMNELNKTADHAKSREQADNRIIGGSIDPKDIKLTKARTGSAGFMDWATDGKTNTLGQVGAIAKNMVLPWVTFGLSNEFGLGPTLQTGPSDKSSNEAVDLMNMVYFGNETAAKHKAAVKPRPNSLIPGFAVNASRAPASSGKLNFKNPVAGATEALPGFASADAVQKWENAELAFINKHAKDIAKTGGNDKNSQAQIMASINQVKQNLKTAAGQRMAALQGLSELDQMNLTQLANLTEATSTLSGLNAQTVAANPAAIKTILQQTGLAPTNSAYKALTNAYRGSQTNTLGVNSKGDMGKYSTDGQWHPATRADIANLSVTERDNLPKLSNGPASDMDRMKALRTAYQAAITQASVTLDSNKYAPTSDQYKAANTAMTTNMMNLQGVNTQIAETQSNTDQSRGALLEATAGSPALAKQLGLKGGDKAAISSMNKTVKDLQAANLNLTSDDPKYWSNLQAIQQAKSDIAALQASPQLNALQLAAANTVDQVALANNKYQQALLTQRTDIKKGVSSAQRGADRTAVAAAAMSQTQSREQVAEATAQANMAGDQNSVQKAYDQYHDALRLEGIYAKGHTLGDQASEQQAIGQAKQAKIAIADAIEAQTQSAYDATAAWQAYHGNQLGSLYTLLKKANQAYATAVARHGAGSTEANAAWQNVAQAQSQVRDQLQADAQATFDVTAAIDTMQGNAVGAAQQQYVKAVQAYNNAVTDHGKKSAQAREAYAQMIQAQQALYTAELDKQNSALDLQIAQLQARGQQGDAEHAAQDAVQKIKNEIAAYKKRGGKAGTKEYNDLQSQLATAQRNAFDVGLQAQMDTLDFQQQTYQITSAQEVAALQQILKNKQLTLQEQRDITMKIKNLQDSIRQELTQGGLNIPSNITLPTAYDVRRSLGAGFGGVASQQSGGTTNNNNQQVTIQNSVVSSSQVAEITRQVVQAVNATFGRQVRASTSTPRVVATK